MRVVVWRDLSIRRKLAAGTVVASGLALLAACGAFLALNQFEQRRALAQRLSGLAEILAYNSAVAVEFRDRDSMEELLSALSSHRAPGPLRRRRRYYF